MISGRFRWNDAKGAAIPGKVGHAALDFDSGTLTDNGLTIGALPSGIPLTEVTVQTSVAGQVNLIISTGTAVGYWDGSATVPLRTRKSPNFSSGCRSRA